MYRFGRGSVGRTRRRGLRVAAFAALATLSAGAVGERGAALPGNGFEHPLRLSVAETSFLGATMRVRVRFFWDDLQFAVMERTGDLSFELAESARSDSTVVRYVNEMLVFDGGDGPVRGRLLERGVERARRPDETMWWYRLEYPLPLAVERVRIRNRLLFNMFEDQSNLVLLETRSGEERTYRFTWDEDDVSVGIA